MKNILYLDYDVIHVPGINLITEINLGHLDSYVTCDALQDHIARMTSGSNLDYVVIGNNLEIGIKKASAVDPSMRSRTCIIWNRYLPEETEPYKKLGITTFLRRDEIYAHLNMLFNN